MSLLLASDVLIALPCTQTEVTSCQKHVSFDVSWRLQKIRFINGREFQEIKSNQITKLPGLKN